MNAEEIWAQYENMFHSIANRIAGAGAPMHDDLVQEGFLGVMEKLPSYDSTASSVSTWVYRVARFRMLDFIRAGARNGPVLDVTDSGEDEKPGLALPARTSWLENLLTEMGDEAQALIHAILEAPEELAQITWRRPAQGLQEVESYMIDAKDWRMVCFRRSCAEIRGCIDVGR